MKNKARKSDDLRFAFETEWLIHGLKEPVFQPVKEFRFADDVLRGWRFDYAFTNHRVAVELEGGTFSRRPVRCRCGKVTYVNSMSRHTTAQGHHDDCDKYNYAASQGWLVLKFTAHHVKNSGRAVVRRIANLLKTIDSKGLKNGTTAS